MDKKLLGFIILVSVLVLAQWWTTESFIDCSGSNCVTINASTLMTLLGKLGDTTSDSETDTGSTTYRDRHRSTLDQQFYNDLKGDMLKEIKTSVSDEIAKNRTLLVGDASYDGSDYASCGFTGSMADAQGQAFLQTAPGKNPNDYIRKDSIPCYGCSLK